ncbi:hypothetical protein SAMN05216174_106327 [Actinokineospora iranica]|uniref:Uncharacterized protein n=1 Tax=Actinokineospora iranica TaxID=1271860 RepID=A0A1G6RHG4_9PSEU|nr:hypothetical protein SAMN05216174_106327 [Actinokineospora iranica]
MILLSTAWSTERSEATTRPTSALTVGNYQHISNPFGWFYLDKRDSPLGNH